MLFSNLLFLRDIMKTVLLVEDEALIAMNEAAVLEDHGFEVTTAHSAEKAIELVENNGIDLILMDIDLGKGKMDGTEAAQCILENHTIPIVFLTNHVEKEYVERVKKISGYGYILKNSGEFVLIESINMAFTLFETNQSLERENEERKKTEQQLRFQAMLLDQIQDRVIATDLNGRITYVNKAECKTFGKSADELIGMHVSEFGDNPSRGTTQQEIIETTLREGSWQGEVINYTEDGCEIDFDARIQLIYDENGEPTGMLGISTDITDRKQSEQALRHSESKMRAILEAIPDMMFINSEDGTFLDHHATENNSLFTSPAQFLGKRIHDVFPSGIASNFHSMVKSVIETGEMQNYEYRLSIAGKPLDFEARIVPYGEKKTLSIVREITEHKQAEEEKDFLMKELNHRVKNNLAMISSLIHLKDSTLGDEVDLSDIARQIDAIKIVHEKLYQGEEITHINFGEYVQELLSTVFSFDAKTITIENTIEEIYVRTKTAIPLGLIINEIATNAIKHGFTSEEARFTIDMHVDEPQIQYVLTISNTGKPFPEEIDMETPETLGLQLIQALVTQIEGTIELQKQPYPVFTIRFPKEEKG
jgi:PAS domain S-box-containing protein